jgi:hypothetical protein
MKVFADIISGILIYLEIFLIMAIPIGLFLALVKYLRKKA